MVYAPAHVSVLLNPKFPAGGPTAMASDPPKLPATGAAPDRGRCLDRSMCRDFACVFFASAL